MWNSTELEAIALLVAALSVVAVFVVVDPMADRRAWVQETGAPKRMNHPQCHHVHRLSHDYTHHGGWSNCSA